MRSTNSITIITTVHCLLLIPRQVAAIQNPVVRPGNDTFNVINETLPQIVSFHGVLVL